MFESLKTGALGVIYSIALPIAKWSAKKLIKYPPPTDKEGFREWALWLCKNRILLVVQQTPTELDDKALTIVQNVLESDVLYTIVWNQLQGVDPLPDKVKELSLFDRIKDKIKSVLHPNNEATVEEEAAADAETGSVMTAIWIFSLLIQTPTAIKTLQDLIDFVKNRLGEANGQF